MAYMIFDANLSAGFTCKSGFVTDRHKFYIPPFMTYQSVVSMDIVKIVLILEAVNGSDVKCSGDQNP